MRDLVDQDTQVHQDRFHTPSAQLDRLRVEVASNAEETVAEARHHNRIVSITFDYPQRRAVVPTVRLQANIRDS
jgi:hypothetical protein